MRTSSDLQAGSVVSILRTWRVSGTWSEQGIGRCGRGGCEAGLGRVGGLGLGRRAQGLGRRARGLGLRARARTRHETISPSPSEPSARLHGEMQLLCGSCASAWQAFFTRGLRGVGRHVKPSILPIKSLGLKETAARSMFLSMDSRHSCGTR